MSDDFNIVNVEGERFIMSDRKSIEAFQGEHI
jgi:hypothetical protein